MARKRRIRRKKSDLELPDPIDGLACKVPFTMLLYGPEKIGKSTFASKAHRHLFLATEAGLNFLNVCKAPVEDWEKFREVVLAAKNDPGKYEAYNIDTAENAFDQCQIWVCEKLGIDHPADEDFGKGYQSIRLEFYLQLNALAQLGKIVILTSHEKSVEVKGRAIKTSKMVPTLTNTARRVILPMVDIIGHCGFKMGRDGEPTAKRVINFQPTEVAEAGDRTGLLPKQLPLSYSAFVECMNGGRRPKTTMRRRPKRRS